MPRIKKDKRPDTDDIVNNLACLHDILTALIGVLEGIKLEIYKQVVAKRALWR